MTILCYHSVTPGWTSPLAVAPEHFAEHCAWLARRRTVVPLDRAVASLDASGRLPHGVAALTFDDGFRDFHTYAFPVLARYGLPATVFLVAQTLTEHGQRVDWVDTPPAEELQTLDLEQVREMQSAGVGFASHSWSHADLTTLGFDACVRDLRDSRELLESLLGHRVRFLAYPRGRHDATVRAAAERAGYTHAFTLPESRESSGPYAIPRVGLYHGNGVGALRVKAARPYLRVRTGPAYELARRVRRRTEVAVPWRA
ncbi:MAG TPA: polysaccharide deacetylase family protein [Nocardioidaceae bacterium]